MPATINWAINSANNTYNINVQNNSTLKILLSNNSVATANISSTAIRVMSGANLYVWSDPSKTLNINAPIIVYDGGKMDVNTLVTYDTTSTFSVILPTSGISYSYDTNFYGKNTLGDSYWGNVSLIMNCNSGSSVDSNSIYLDSSPNNYYVDVYGTPIQGSNNPYLSSGFWSTGFSQQNGLSSIGNINLDFRTGNYTLECWVYLTKASGELPIMSNWSGANGTARVIWSINSNKLYYYSNNTAFNPSMVYTADEQKIPLYTWTHVAICRNGGIINGFVNGILSLSSTGITSNTSYNPTGLTHTFGYYSGTGGVSDGAGLISNLRIIKGTCLYTSKFNPPTAPLQSTDDTILLTFNSRNFLDSSSVKTSLTPSGTPFTTPESPFLNTPTPSAVGSLYLDGGVNYLTVPSNTATALSSNDFTIEFWAYTLLPNSNSIKGIYSNYNTFGSNSIFIGKHSTAGGKMVFWAQNLSGSPILTDPLLPTQSWTHYAIVRNGNLFKMYRNGTAVSTYTYNGVNPLTLNSNISYIGTDGQTTSNSYNGYITDFKISNGSALYNSDFEPTPLKSISDSNTSLLLNFENSLIFDNGYKNNIKLYNNVALTSDKKKYGNASICLTATDSYLEIPNSNLFAFNSGDFTIETWFLTESLNSTATVVGSLGSATTVNGFELNVTAMTGIEFKAWYSGVSYVTSVTGVTVPQGVWNHLALVRSGAGLGIYLNGDILVLNNNLANIPINPSQSILIGSGNTKNYFIGYLDDIRITKGVARYKDTSYQLPAYQNYNRYSPDYNSSYDLDPFISNVTLLLNFDNSIGTTIYDAVENTTITSTGSISINSSIAKFGNSSLYLNGSSYITLGSQSNLTCSGDFTYEFWYYRTATGDNKSVWRLPTGQTLVSNTASLVLYDGIANRSLASSLALNVWNHVALSRTKNILNGFHNGTLMFSVSNSTVYNFSGINIGVNGTSNNNYWTGYFDDIRLTNGTGRYSSSFALPSKPNPSNIDGSLDRYYNNVSLLLNGERTDIADATSHNNLTAYNSTISLSTYKYGLDSVYLSGNSYIMIDDSPSLKFDYNNFTLEFWYNGTVSTTNQTIIYKSSDYSIGILGTLDSTNARGVYVKLGSNTYKFGSNIISNNTWYHIAFSMLNYQLKLFVNGIQINSTITDSGLSSSALKNSYVDELYKPLSGILEDQYIDYITLGDVDVISGGYLFDDTLSTNLYIGCNSDIQNFCVGYLDELKITNGVGKYTRNFIPPLDESKLDVGNFDPFYSNNLLLINGNSIDGINGLKDVTNKNTLYKLNSGELSIDSEIKLYGIGSMRFDIGDTTIPTLSSNNLTAFGLKDFTIETWVYLSSYPTNTFGIFDNNRFNDLDEGSLKFGITNSGNISYFTKNSAYEVRYNSISAIPLSTWTHICLSRSANGAKIYLNGSKIYYDSFNVNLTANGIIIGSWLSGGSWNKENAWLDDYRITYNMDRYSIDFNPSYKQFPTSVVDLYGELTTTIITTTAIYTGLYNTMSTISVTLPLYKIEDKLAGATFAQNLNKSGTNVEVIENVSTWKNGDQLLLSPNTLSSNSLEMNKINGSISNNTIPLTSATYYHDSLSSINIPNVFNISRSIKFYGYIHAISSAKVNIFNSEFINVYSTSDSDANGLIFTTTSSGYVNLSSCSFRLTYETVNNAWFINSRNKPFNNINVTNSIIYNFAADVLSRYNLSLGNNINIIKNNFIKSNGYDVNFNNLTANNIINIIDNVSINNLGKSVYLNNVSLSNVTLTGHKTYRSADSGYTLKYPINMTLSSLNAYYGIKDGFYINPNGLSSLNVYSINAVRNGGTGVAIDRTTYFVGTSAALDLVFTGLTSVSNLKCGVSSANVRPTFNDRVVYANAPDYCGVIVFLVKTYPVLINFD